jgi:hypothetical protein
MCAVVAVVAGANLALFPCPAAVASASDDYLSPATSYYPRIGRTNGAHAKDKESLSTSRV